MSATTGRLLCDFDHIYDIMNHVTGDNLFTHVLPRAFKFAVPLIKAQYPEIVIADASLKSLDDWMKLDKTGTGKEGLKMWLTELKMMFPAIKDEYAIESHSEAWLSKNPIEELADMIPKEKIIAVVL